MPGTRRVAPSAYVPHEGSIQQAALCLQIDYFSICYTPADCLGNLVFLFLKWNFSCMSLCCEVPVNTFCCKVCNK